MSVTRLWSGLLQAETKEIVVERIALEEAQARAAQAAPRHDEGDINTDDDEDDPEEFSLWQSREMARIARYRLPCVAMFAPGLMHVLVGSVG